MLQCNGLAYTVSRDEVEKAGDAEIVWPRRHSHQIKMMHADVPAGRRVADGLRREDLGAVHQPFHDRAGIITPEDIAAAITVEIAGTGLMPLSAEIAERHGR